MCQTGNPQEGDNLADMTMSHHVVQCCLIGSDPMPLPHHHQNARDVRTWDPGQLIAGLTGVIFVTFQKVKFL